MIRKDAALDLLIRLIEDGIEYPDAEFRVAVTFELTETQIERLRQLYDQQTHSSHN
ncbi:hypothetical protein [Merismopedia glauca]|uniref:hypothetical protein n=1 Tax=Merismopedia glauca TaxID=292586 RepID=UPI0015E7DB5E|nr:hypothetical protein [Merismopedia glauca]